MFTHVAAFLPTVHFNIIIRAAICKVGKAEISMQSHSLKLHHPTTVGLHWVAEVPPLLYVQV